MKTTTYLRIHDAKDKYKNSCEFPVVTVNVSGTSVHALITHEKYMNCIPEQLNVSIDGTEITFSLDDYHFTTYTK